MKNLYIFIILFFNTILQVTLYNFISIFDVIPNISLVLVVLFSLTTNMLTGGAIGLFTGLLYDFLIMDVIGINALIFFIVGISFGFLANEIDREKQFTYVIFTIVASIIFHLFNFLILFFLGTDTNNFFLIIDKILIQILLNSLICVVAKFLLTSFFLLFNIKLFTNEV